MSDSNSFGESQTLHHFCCLHLAHRLEASRGTIAAASTSTGGSSLIHVIFGAEHVLAIVVNRRALHLCLLAQWLAASCMIR